MSKAVCFTDFCKRYELNIASEESKKEYKIYCDNLAFVNHSIADKTTNEAITKAKDYLR